MYGLYELSASSQPTNYTEGYQGQAEGPQGGSKEGDAIRPRDYYVSGEAQGAGDGLDNHDRDKSSSGDENQKILDALSQRPEAPETMDMLYCRFAGPLYRYACATLRNEEAAKDVVQETMIGAWRSAPSFAGRSSVATWIFAICSNKIKDHVRGQSRATAGPRSPAGMSIRGEPSPPQSGGTRPGATPPAGEGNETLVSQKGVTELLPWAGTGSLSQEEEARVLAHAVISHAFRNDLLQTIRLRSLVAGQVSQIEFSDRICTELRERLANDCVITAQAGDKSSETLAAGQSRHPGRLIMDDIAPRCRMGHGPALRFGDPLSEGRLFTEVVPFIAEVMLPGGMGELPGALLRYWARRKYLP